MVPLILSVILHHWVFPRNPSSGTLNLATCNFILGILINLTIWYPRNYKSDFAKMLSLKICCAVQIEETNIIPVHKIVKMI